MQKISIVKEAQFSSNITHKLDPYQMLPFRVRKDLGAMAIEEYSAFPKDPALLESHHQIV